MSFYECDKTEFSISTDKNRLQIEVIQSFLQNESYWASNRTIEQTQTALENSLCFGVYQADKQIGFARVVTDFATWRCLYFTRISWSRLE